MSSKLDKLRNRVVEYRNRTPIISVEPGKSITSVTTPVETNDRAFIDIDDLPASLEEMPFVPERMRDFAFRYANEMKPLREWAKVYGVSQSAISKWLANENVRKLIAMVKYERRSYTQGAMLQLEQRMFSKMNEILEIRVTTDNMNAVINACKLIHEITQKPEDMAHPTKGQIYQNINIGVGGVSSNNGDRPYRHEKDVTEDDIDKMKETFDYHMHMIREASDGDYGKNPIPLPEYDEESGEDTPADN